MPLVVSLGSPFEIALDRPPAAADRQPSFLAGLNPGSVHIRSDGAAACVQIDLTPLGAHRLLGEALGELASRMVELDALFGPAARALRERLGATPGWAGRLDLVAGFVAARLRHRPAPEIEGAWRRLAETGGSLSVGRLAAELGWSRQHLSERFRRQLGLSPKRAARLLRFRRARRLALAGAAGGWAEVAAACGYSDQAHLAREFAALAGESPTAWARRAGARAPLEGDAAAR